MTPARLQIIPVPPRRLETAVAGEIDARLIGRRSASESIDHFNQNRSAVLLFVQRVEIPESVERALIPQSIEQHHAIEVIANGVPSREQPRLDASHFRQRGNTKAGHDRIGERLLSAKLANAGLDSVEPPQNHYRSLKPLSPPPSGRFEPGQDFVEPIAQIHEDMISVEALAMRCVNGGRRPAHQDGSRDEGLDVAFRSQQAFPVGQLFDHVSSLFLAPEDATGAARGTMRQLAEGTDYRVASPGFGCAASSRSISALNAAKGCAPIRLASVVTFELLGSV